MTKRDIALEVLKNQVDKPYKWGGNDPMEGFDCSGLVVEMLKSVGILGRNDDMTAHMLAQKFNDTDILEPGNLVFYDWDGDGRIDHVEIIVAIDEAGELYTIGASGGGSNTNTEADARAQDAYIKIRPLQSGYKKVVDPF